MSTHPLKSTTLLRAAWLSEPLFDKARTVGQQNNDPNVAIYKANYERVHAKLKETTRKP